MKLLNHSCTTRRPAWLFRTWPLRKARIRTCAGRSELEQLHDCRTCGSTLSAVTVDEASKESEALWRRLVLCWVHKAGRAAHDETEYIPLSRASPGCSLSFSSNCSLPAVSSLYASLSNHGDDLLECALVRRWGKWGCRESTAACPCAHCLRPGRSTRSCQLLKANRVNGYVHMETEM